MSDNLEFSIAGNLKEYIEKTQARMEHSEKIFVENIQAREYDFNSKMTRLLKEQKSFFTFSPFKQVVFWIMAVLNLINTLFFGSLIFEQLKEVFGG